MAHKKGQGSSRNGRDSNSQRRGTKVYGGQEITAGSIIVRQVGTKIHPGTNVKRGRDFTLWNKPVEEPCPKCKWPFLTEKITKRHGRQLMCHKEDCDYVRSEELATA